MKKLKEKFTNKLGEKKIAKLKKFLRVVRIVKNIVCWTLIAILTISVIGFTLTKINGESPTVFGYSIHRIITGSMEPTLMIGDVILNKEVKDHSDIDIGDIVTFQGDVRFGNQKVTHRVVVAPYDDNGKLVLVTKGDANEKEDGVIEFSSVESKYLTKVGFLTTVYSVFFSTWGFLIFIFLLVLIFFDEIVNIIKLTVGTANEGKTESIQEIVERVRIEKLEESRKKKDAEKSQTAEQSIIPEEQSGDDSETQNDSASTDPQSEKATIGNEIQKKDS